MDTTHYNKNSDKFDIDAWIKLHKENPEAFEQKRQEVLKNFIDAAPAHNQFRLRGLQFQIDAIRRQSKTPHQATLELSHWMVEKFLKSMVEKFADLKAILQGQTPKPVAPPTLAQVLDFRSKAAVITDEPSPQ